MRLLWRTGQQNLDLESKQLAQEFREAITVPVCEARLDDEVLSFDIPTFF